jgi:hypothetical protein
MKANSWKNWGRRPLAFAIIAHIAFVVSALGALQAFAQENPQGIIAAQLRAQGYPCASPKSAKRDQPASKPGEAVWMLECGNALYRVRLVPNIAARVETIDRSPRKDRKDQ